MIQPARITILPGSNRTGSHNARLAAVLARELSLAGAEVGLLTLRDYPMPIYDADEEAAGGVPEYAMQLARRLHESDAVILVCPEYNASVTPLMKNTIDWLSRIRADGDHALQPYGRAVFALASASPGKLGGIRGLTQIRASLVSIGALVLSEQLAVGNAGEAYDELDNLLDARTRSMMERFARAVMNKATLFAGGRHG